MELVLSKRYKADYLSEQKINKHLFKTRILSYHIHSELSRTEELRLQKKHQVVFNKNYINESYASIDGYFGRRVHGEENPRYGMKHSDIWNKGRKETRPEVLENLRKSHLGQIPWNKGQTGGTNKIKGRIYPKVGCPHCGKMVGENSKGRYHFDNCKSK